MTTLISFRASGEFLDFLKTHQNQDESLSMTASRLLKSMSMKNTITDTTNTTINTDTDTTTITTDTDTTTNITDDRLSKIENRLSELEKIEDRLEKIENQLSLSTDTNTTINTTPDSEDETINQKMIDDIKTVIESLRTASKKTAGTALIKKVRAACDALEDALESISNKTPHKTPTRHPNKTP